jgi:hypothetical protein
MSRCVKRTILCQHEDANGTTCEKALTVELSPFSPGTRMDPPEGGDVEDIYGCEHAEQLDHAVVLAALEDDHD